MIKVLLTLLLLIPSLSKSEDFTIMMYQFCSGLAGEITSGINYNNFISKRIDEFSDELSEIDTETNKAKYDETFKNIQDYISARNEQQEVLLRKSSLFNYTCIIENQKRLDYYQRENFKNLIEKLD